MSRAWRREDDVLQEVLSEELGEEPSCRVCGCTTERACPGGCIWVEDPEGGDLCSGCYRELYGDSPG